MHSMKEAMVLAVSRDEVMQSIIQSLSFLKAELKRLEETIKEHIDSDPDLRGKKTLLETIPGVGERVSSNLTALFAAKTFNSAEQLAAYLGERRTGVDGHDKLDRRICASCFTCQPSSPANIILISKHSAIDCSPRARPKWLS